MNGPGGLSGIVVAVTRPTRQAGELVRLLLSRGASTVEVPLIEIVGSGDGGRALRSAVGDLASYDWVVVTSQNGAERFCAELGDAGRLGRVQVAAVGRATAAVLEDALVPVALVPGRQVADGLLGVFPTAPAAGGRVLLARAVHGSSVFPDGARLKGWVVDDVGCYQTVAAEVSDAQAALLRSVDVVTFTSPSAVAAFVEALPPGAAPTLACIGPSTAARARELGLMVQVQATDHSLEGLVEAIGGYLGPW